jgi:hypothetical protein
MLKVEIWATRGYFPLKAPSFFEIEMERDQGLQDMNKIREWGFKRR